tara:strand:+ start:61 stop:483 length:423 start_codon:yes stop_codon:yes gene_type:complete
MKKFLSILLVSLLLSGNAYAAENYKCMSIKDIFGIYPKKTVDLDILRYDLYFDNQKYVVDNKSTKKSQENKAKAFKENNGSAYFIADSWYEYQDDLHSKTLALFYAHPDQKVDYDIEVGLSMTLTTYPNNVVVYKFFCKE